MNWFWNTNVDSILRRFSKIINNLEAAAEHHTWLEEDSRKKQELYSGLMLQAKAEAFRASKIAEKLKKLLEVD